MKTLTLLLISLVLYSCSSDNVINYQQYKEVLQHHNGSESEQIVGFLKGKVNLEVVGRNIFLEVLTNNKHKLFEYTIGESDTTNLKFDIYQTNAYILRIKQINPEQYWRISIR